ncbi:MAG: YeeE/YedE family protein [Polyangiaceae bacterium]
MAMSLLDQSVVRAVGGGVVIGFAALLLLVINGRIAGVSGIAAGLLRGVRGQFGWRAAFIGGLVAAGVVAELWSPSLLASSPASLSVLALAGLCVGAGTQIGGGCTSGHGVCGLGRLSLRSLVAVCAFVVSGALTATLVGVAR